MAEYDLRLDTLYELEPIQRLIWSRVLTMNPVRIRRAYTQEWSEELAKSVLRKTFGPGNCDVDFLIGLPTAIVGEQRTVKFRLDNLQSVHADEFFRHNYIKFVLVNDKIECVAIRK